MAALRSRKPLLHRLVRPFLAAREESRPLPLWLAPAAFAFLLPFRACFPLSIPQRNAQALERPSIPASRFLHGSLVQWPQLQGAGVFSPECAALANVQPAPQPRSRWSE